LRSDSTSVEARERLVVAKAKKEEQLAKEAALRVAERGGKLIDARRALEEGRRAGMTIRDGILSVPARVAAQIASMTDEREVERLLTAALRAELTRLADLAANGDR
jgi:phage terminase Nu1 subunit (DNA packaging protein)